MEGCFSQSLLYVDNHMQWVKYAEETSKNAGCLAIEKTCDLLTIHDASATKNFPATEPQEQTLRPLKTFHSWNMDAYTAETR